MDINFTTDDKRKKFNYRLIFGTGAYILYKKHMAKRNTDLGGASQSCTTQNSTAFHTQSKPVKEKPYGIIEMVRDGIIGAAFVGGYFYLWVHKFILGTGGFWLAVQFYLATFFVAAGIAVVFTCAILGVFNDKDAPNELWCFAGSTALLVLYIGLFGFPAWWRSEILNDWNIFYGLLILTGWVQLFIYVIFAPIRLILYHRDKKRDEKRKTGTPR